MELVREAEIFSQRWHFELQTAHNADIVDEAGQIAKEELSLASTLDVVGTVNTMSEEVEEDHFELFAACSAVEDDENYAGSLDDFVSDVEKVDNLWADQIDQASQTDLSVLVSEDDDLGFPLKILAA